MHASDLTSKHPPDPTDRNLLITLQKWCPCYPVLLMDHYTLQDAGNNSKTNNGRKFKNYMYKKTTNGSRPLMLNGRPFHLSIAASPNYLKCIQMALFKLHRKICHVNSTLRGWDTTPQVLNSTLWSAELALQDLLCRELTGAPQARGPQGLSPLQEARHSWLFLGQLRANSRPAPLRVP